MKSIKKIVREYDNVLKTRERIEKIFRNITGCWVSIGGSYALKYGCEAFEEREISDYDFILWALPENMPRITAFIDLLNKQTGCIKTCQYYGYKSFYMGTCNGLKANVILRPSTDVLCTEFESVKDIIKIKKAWCDEAIKKGKKPRHKDILDISIYEDWQIEHDLPF